MNGDLLDACHTRLEDYLAYTRSTLGKIASRSPVECARYFNAVVKIVVDVVLAYQQPGLHEGLPGLFGKTKAYFATTESQNLTGDLHFHMLVWIDGAPSTVAEYYEHWKDETWREQIAAYARSIVTMDTPHSSKTCPRCKQSDVEAIPLVKTAYRRPRPQAVRVPTSRCGSCKAEYGSGELLREQLNIRSIALGQHPDEISDMGIHHAIARPQPLTLPSGDDNASSVIFTKALLSFQEHRWTHSKSCFKVSGRTPNGDICRMFFPKPPVESSHADNNGTITHRRPIGHEYLNGYSRIIAATIKANHDIKLLCAGEGPEKAFYMMNYAAKEQQQIENHTLIHLNAYDKAAQRHNSGSDAQSTGTRRIMSCVASLTNAQEVASPMAALYVYRGDTNYASHTFVKLRIRAAIAAIERDEHECLLQPDSGGLHFRPTSDYMDYIHRPDHLESCHFYGFVKGWVSKRGGRGMEFLGSHARARTHVIEKAPPNVCVTVTGPRLPNIYNPALPTESRALFAKMVLIMFKPFRNRSDLPDSSQNWIDSCDAWLANTAPDEARMYITNTLDYYVSRNTARERPDADAQHYVNLDDIDQHDVCAISYSDSENEDGEYDDDRMSECEWDQDRMISSLLQTELDSDSVPNYGNAISRTSLASAQVQDLPRAGPVTTQLVQAEIDAAQATPDVIPVAPLTNTSSNGDRDTMVRILQNLDLAPRWEPPRSDQSYPIPNHAQLQTVSQQFHLNLKQHEMFVAAGSALLQSFQVDEGITNQQNQFRGFLSGLPGGGKSLVIKALQALAESWGRPASVITVANQGVAAQAADGETIHKCFGWGKDGMSNSWRPNQAQLEKFAAAKLIIMDEVSTTDVKLLGQADICLRRIRQDDKLFGGLHLLLVGDWLQQLPVAGTPAFLPANTGGHRSRAGPDADGALLQRIRGHDCYRQIQTVVILTENMRHKNDPHWARILELWRTGQYNAQDLDTVNTACYLRGWDSLQVTDWFCPIIVTSNKLRVDFNRAALQSHCINTNTTCHVYSAELTHSRKTITENERRSLRLLRDDKTGNLAMELHLALGMPVQCTKNVSKQLHLANGTIARIVHIQSDPADNPRHSTHNGMSVTTHSHLPQMVLIQVRGCHKLILPSLTHGVTAVMPRLERSVAVQLPDRSFRLNIRQIPLIPAFSITSDKSQGLTVDQMILGPLRHPSRRSPQKAALYVALTRVRTMSRLSLMEPLTPQLVGYFQPSQEILNEVSRLQLVSNRS